MGVPPHRVSTSPIEQVYERYFEEIYGFCYRRLSDREAAEDATSAVFLKLAQSLAELAPHGLPAIRGWLYGSARNAIRSEIRRIRREKKAAEALRHGVSAFECAPPGTEYWPETEAALERLGPEQNRVIRMRFFEGYKLKEIADVLGKKPATVRSILWRGLKKLRRDELCKKAREQLGAKSQGQKG